MKNLTKGAGDNLRYERKFLIQGTDRLTIESFILQNPLFFREVYQERWVNNVYFDHLLFDNFHDNIEGNTYREKFRIRWYGDMFQPIKKPVLELKIKKGLLGNKKSFPLDPFDLDNKVTHDQLRQLIANSKIDPKIQFQVKEQFPVMLNRYRRKYYLSEDRKFRVTIDDHQSFYKLNKLNNLFLQKFKDFESTVLEIKYDHNLDSEASKISQYFPFRMTKNSKYATGIEMLYY